MVLFFSLWLGLLHLYLRWLSVSHSGRPCDLQLSLSLSVTLFSSAVTASPFYSLILFLGHFSRMFFQIFLSVPKNELGVSLDKWPSLKSPVIKSRLKSSGLTCCLTERHSNPDRTRETRVINTTIILLKVYMRHSIDNVDSVLSVMFILCKLAKQLLPPYHPVQSPVDNQEQETKRAL